MDVRNWNIQVEIWFRDDLVHERYDQYVSASSSFTSLTYSVERDYLGSGFDFLKFDTEAERTQVVQDLKELGVPDDVIVLTKEIEG
jgi:hypothetical protein